VLEPVGRRSSITLINHPNFKKSFHESHRDDSGKTRMIPCRARYVHAVTVSCATFSFSFFLFFSLSFSFSLENSRISLTCPHIRALLLSQSFLRISEDTR